MLWVEVFMRQALAVFVLAVFAVAQDAPEPEEKKAPDIYKIYVPYEKLDEVFGTEKERVMVPYKEFLELWKLKYGPKRPSDKAPVPFAVESAVLRSSDLRSSWRTLRCGSPTLRPYPPRHRLSEIWRWFYPMALRPQMWRRLCAMPLAPSLKVS